METGQKDITEKYRSCMIHINHVNTAGVMRLISMATLLVLVTHNQVCITGSTEKNLLTARCHECGQICTSDFGLSSHIQHKH